jgi:ATP-dependent helicase/nuclease subunit B
MAAVYSIAPSLPFLPTLAEALVAWPQELLADTLVLLPSRRACLGLREALAQAAPGRTLLLPRLMPIGEVNAEELLLDAEAELALPAALPPLRRHLLLTRLVLARDKEMKHEQAIRLANELMRFLDEVATESLPLERLEGLVEGELASHWQDTLRFLRILGELWPRVVAEEGRIDPVERRNQLLSLWAARWEADPPRSPVLAAGITGSIPRVADLLAIIARLPKGAVILPGLDEVSEAQAWAAVGASHPQHSLKQLLERIGIAREAVRPWSSRRPDDSGMARTSLMIEVMRPARTSAAWQALPPPSDAALRGLEIATAPDLPTEALQLALRIRQALEVPGKRVALVTSDRNLARRVAVELGRWGVRADDSAGVPLDQSAPGSFLLLCAHAVVSGGRPIDVLAALKHPLAAGGLPPGEFRRQVRRLERQLLRGPRRHGGLEGLSGGLRARGDSELADWLDQLRAAAEKLSRLCALPDVPLLDLVEAHLALAEWLAADAEGDPHALWAKEAGAAAQRFVLALREAAPVLGPTPGSAYPALLAVLMGRETVRPFVPAHPRVAILGQLESRLQAADLVLIGGLNEGVWPRHAESGPWLNRPMRAAFGLPPVELQVGIAAHDLFMAALAPEIVFSRARKDESGAPTVPSRWLARLEAVLDTTGRRAAVEPDPSWQRWAAALDWPNRPGLACARPQPRPPLASRPHSLTATDIERLIRDPYAVYAQHILALVPLDPVDADPGLPERGLIIHKILERFVCLELDGSDPLARLLALGREHFAALRHAPELHALWWPRFIAIAAWFCDRHREREEHLAVLKAEIEGSLTLDLPSGQWRIRARADRVEHHRDGGLSILDYKTGRVPSPGEVRQGVRPQLLIEALIAAEGGFPGLPAAVPKEILHWGLRGKETEPGQVSDPLGEEPLEALVARARAGLERVINFFADPANGYIAIPRPEIAPGFSAYEHLARVSEWRDTREER